MSPNLKTSKERRHQTMHILSRSIDTLFHIRQRRFTDFAGRVRGPRPRNSGLLLNDVENILLGEHTIGDMVELVRNQRWVFEKRDYDFGEGVQGSGWEWVDPIVRKAGGFVGEIETENTISETCACVRICYISIGKE